MAALVALFVVIAGFLIGLLIGRWWAIVAALIAGIAAGRGHVFPIDGWDIGLVAAGVTGLAVSVGVGARRSRFANLSY